MLRCFANIASTGLPQSWVWKGPRLDWKRYPFETLQLRPRTWLCVECWLKLVRIIYCDIPLRNFVYVLQHQHFTHKWTQLRAFITRPVTWFALLSLAAPRVRFRFVMWLLRNSAHSCNQTCVDWSRPRLWLGLHDSQWLPMDIANSSAVWTGRCVAFNERFNSKVRVPPDPYLFRFDACNHFLQPSVDEQLLGACEEVASFPAQATWSEAKHGSLLVLRICIVDDAPVRIVFFYSFGRCNVGCKATLIHGNSAARGNASEHSCPRDGARSAFKSQDLTNAVYRVLALLGVNENRTWVSSFFVTLFPPSLIDVHRIVRDTPKL